MESRKPIIIRIEEILRLTVIGLLLLSLTGCGMKTPSAQETPDLLFQEEDGIKTYSELVVGYSQIGAESEWRTGNTDSIKESRGFTDNLTSHVLTMI